MKTMQRALSVALIAVAAIMLSAPRAEAALILQKVLTALPATGECVPGFGRLSFSAPPGGQI
jgi:hypothetical protein